MTDASVLGLWQAHGMDDRPILDMASVQDGAVTRWQAEQLGMTRRQVEWRLE